MVSNEILLMNLFSWSVIFQNLWKRLIDKINMTQSDLISNAQQLSQGSINLILKLIFQIQSYLISIQPSLLKRAALQSVTIGIFLEKL